MTNHQADTPIEESAPDTFVRVWHLFALILCFVALATGDLADDYKKMKYFGFLVHGWAGLGFSFALCCYLVYGLAGPRQAWFFRRPPFNRKQFGQAVTELKGLAGLKMPDHRNKQGLVGLVQYIGILIFGWQALTGCILYLCIEPGQRASGMLHAVKEAHEVGAALIPIFLLPHIGAVIIHSFAGNPVWKTMFIFRKKFSDPVNVEDSPK